MRQAPAAAALLGIMSYNMVLMLILSCATTNTANAHNITSILADHPEFTAFNKYLSLTRLNVEINARKAVTVLAVDNAGMSELISIYNTAGKIALRSQVVVIILDYYLDAKKLHEMIITNSNNNNNNGAIRVISTNATMFGGASGSSDPIRSTSSVLKMDISFVKEVGKVAFRTKDGLLESYSFVKCVEQIPPSSSTISVLQVSRSQLLKSNHQARSMAELNSDSSAESSSPMSDPVRSMVELSTDLEVIFDYQVVAKQP